jgi:hypothetical protein
MKMQQQVLRCAQEDNPLVIARPIFRADPSAPFGAKNAPNSAQDDSGNWTAFGQRLEAGSLELFRNE